MLLTHSASHGRKNHLGTGADAQLRRGARHGGRGGKWTRQAAGHTRLGESGRGHRCVRGRGAATAAGEGPVEADGAARGAQHCV